MPLPKFRCLLLVAAVTLTGCASPSMKVPLAPNALRPGQKIHLIRSPEVKHYTVQAPHIGMAFGAIGGVIAAAEMQRRGQALQTLMHQQQFAPADVLTAALVQALQKAGFTVELIDDPWQVGPDGATTLDPQQLPPAKLPALVVVPSVVGFATSNAFGEYAATTWAVATLYGSDPAKPLYRGLHATGWKPFGKGWTYTVPATTSGVTSFDDLLARPAHAADQLRQAVSAVANSVVRELRP